MSLKYRLKKILFNYLGVILNDYNHNLNTFSEILQNSCLYDNINSFDYRSSLIFILFSESFNNKQNKVYKIKNINYYNKYKKISLDYHKLINNTKLLSPIGSMITYKGKINKTLFYKQINIVNALEYLDDTKIKKIRVLEIGFNLGYFANLVLSYSNKIYYEGVDISNKDLIIKSYEMLKKKYKNNIVLNIMSSKLFISKLISKKIKFDLIHIDGSHEYEDVIVDLDLSNKLLRKGGVLVFDDINGDGPARALYEFKFKSNYEFFYKQVFCPLHPHIILKKK